MGPRNAQDKKKKHMETHGTVLNVLICFRQILSR